MRLNNIKPFVISVFIHMAIITLIIAIASPHPKKVEQRASIQSYLYTKPLVLKPSDSEPSLITPENTITPLSVEEPNEIEQATPVQNQPLPVTRPIDDIDEHAIQNYQTEQPSLQNNASASLNKTPTILSNSAKYIAELNSKKLNVLSQQAVQEYYQPKPLIDNSRKLSTNERLKAQSADFAPPGSGIIVLSESGPNEKTIVVDGSCMTVTETDLLDPISRGASVWLLGGAGCQKYDKFNGQLQKSLDKYLKN